MAVQRQAMPALGAARDASLAQAAYDSIKQQIISCEVRPGDTLHAGRLSDELNMSRTPVHEALKRLCTDGLLAVKPRVGYEVSSLTVKDAQEIFQMRLGLERVGAELAADRIKDSDVRRLEKIASDSRRFARTLRSDSQASVVEFERHNRVFHLAVASLSGNERLVGTLQGLLEQCQRFTLLEFHSHAEDYRSSRAHEAVLDALRGRDREAAGLAMSQHIRDAQSDVIKLLLAGVLHESSFAAL